MAKKITPEVVKNTKVEDEKSTKKVKLKCNYDMVEKNKDGEKIVTKKPDEIVTLPASVANKLIADAFAVEEK